MKLGKNCLTCYRHIKARDGCMYLAVKTLCEFAGEMTEVEY